MTYSQGKVTLIELWYDATSIGLFVPFALIMIMQLVRHLFISFYENCRRQEAEGSFVIKVRGFRYMRVGVDPYECTEMEFNQLVSICREIAKINPKALSLVEDFSYDDPPEKIIGSHNVEGAMLLNHSELSELVARCMLRTYTERADQDT